MAPLLFFASEGAWANLPGFLPYLAAACGCALLANLAQTFAVRHLPMAISVAIGQALAAIATLVIVLLDGEPLPPLSELACIAGVMTGVIVLGFITSHGQKVQSGAKPMLGILACIAFGVAMASALVPLAWCRDRLIPLSLPGAGRLGLACLVSPQL